MLQTVDGHDNVFVVEFDTMPSLPITWNTFEEKPYADALVDAIQNGVIKKPGKYGIVIEPRRADTTMRYSIYAIKE